jgi:protocatechuate 3,4-dioxygenase beta subunit
MGSKVFLIFFFASIISKSSQAIKPEIILKNIEYLTPAIEIDEQFKPQYFNHNNNLRRKVGSPFIAKGQLLVIEGYVTDLLNIPIENARIRIWQTNNFGYYNYLARGLEDNTKYDVDFESTGTATTDSLGYYIFFTIIPGFFGNQAPYINFLIDHDRFEEFRTVMFFPNHPRNAIDNNYRQLSLKNRELITCKMRYINAHDKDYGKRCYFDIKLNVLHPTKRY